MTLSELIAAYGDDRVTFQKIDDCATSLNMTSKGTRISFVTPERMNTQGTEKMGLVVWMDRERVSELLSRATEKSDGC